MDTATAAAGNTDREAAYAEAAKLKPTRYTSDPDVINSPAETLKVKALWAVYFRAMDAALAQYPYTEEEKERRAMSTVE